MGLPSRPTSGTRGEDKRAKRDRALIRQRFSFKNPLGTGTPRVAALGRQLFGGIAPGQTLGQGELLRATDGLAVDDCRQQPVQNGGITGAGLDAQGDEIIARHLDMARFGVVLDPDTEVVSLIGSKEGIAHFPLAYVNPGDLVLVCSPNYPVYPVATGFCGGEVKVLPLTEEGDFLPDLDAVNDATWARAKMIFINYPNNPTAATATRPFFEKLIAKARATQTIVVSDAAYTELYYDPSDKPLSILEIDGAKDVAIEFHSLSKTFNMCRDLGLTVLKLVRTSQGPLSLGTLPPGRCRELTAEERAALRRAVGLDKATAPARKPSSKK